jgi:hypothetical protein
MGRAGDVWGVLGNYCGLVCSIPVMSVGQDKI